jgi:hypothetical protein
MPVCDPSPCIWFERERAVKVRRLAAAALTAALAIAITGCQKSGNEEGGASEEKELVVWLMKGSAPETVINAVNK